MFFCDRKTLGSTISMEATLLETLKHGNNEGMYSLQICLGSPMVFKRKEISPSDIKKSREYLTQNPMNVFSHLPYVYNFAGSKTNKVLNWAGDTDRDYAATVMLKAVEYELDVMSKICPDGCKTGCVLHIGSWDDRDKGIQKVIESINRMKFPENSRLLLETMVGRGGVLGSSINELHNVISGVDERQKQHLQICIDTCHVHSNGQYDLRKYKGVQDMFRDYEEHFSDRIGLIHLNDSMTDFNSGKDRHELIGKGTIWCDPNRSVLSRLLDMIDDKGIPTVLETDESDYKIIQSWND